MFGWVKKVIKTEVDIYKFTPQSDMTVAEGVELTHSMRTVPSLSEVTVYPGRPIPDHLIRHFEFIRKDFK